MGGGFPRRVTGQWNCRQDTLRDKQPRWRAWIVHWISASFLSDSWLWYHPWGGWRSSAAYLYLNQAVQSTHTPYQEGCVRLIRQVCVVHPLAQTVLYTWIYPVILCNLWVISDNDHKQSWTEIQPRMISD